MYNQKMVAAIKSNGKVLREFGDKVFLPWGTEYSIFLKNQNSLKAEVKVSIDGQDVTDGRSLVINANSSLDLERFLKDSDKGNRFRFIERTGNIEAHRGIGSDDGLVRISWQFERRLPKVEDVYIRRNYYYDPHYHWYHPPYWNGPFYGSSNNHMGQNVGTSWSSEKMKSAGCPVTSQDTSTVSSNSASSGILRGTVTTQSFVNQVGITAPGSVSDQKFETVAGLCLDPEEFSMVIHLCGETAENVQVKQAVTVKNKPTCSMCGKTNKATAHFCMECGTALAIIA